MESHNLNVITYCEKHNFSETVEGLKKINNPNTLEDSNHELVAPVKLCINNENLKQDEKASQSYDQANASVGKNTYICSLEDKTFIESKEKCMSFEVLNILDAQKDGETSKLESNIDEPKKLNVTTENLLINEMKNHSDFSIKKDLNGLKLPELNLSLPNACKSGNVDLVKSLLNKSTEMIDVKVDGWTCLHDVSMRECQFSEITELLLEHGANVNEPDESGNTPLHIAIMYHCTGNVKVLLKYNADIHKRNKQGANSIDTAHNIKDNDILELLGQQPVQERKRRRTKIKLKSNININVHANTSAFQSPPILKKRKLDDDEQSLPAAKKRCVKFSEKEVEE